MAAGCWIAIVVHLFAVRLVGKCGGGDGPGMMTGGPNHEPAVARQRKREFAPSPFCRWKLAPIAAEFPIDAYHRPERRAGSSSLIVSLPPKIRTLVAATVRMQHFHRVSF